MDLSITFVVYLLVFVVYENNYSGWGLFTKQKTCISSNSFLCDAHQHIVNKLTIIYLSLFNNYNTGYNTTSFHPILSKSYFN